MKKFYILMILALAVSGVRAQEQTKEATTQRLDSLQQVVDRLTTNVATLEKENLNQAIWKDRAKYFNIGYVKQTLTDKTFGGDITSDFGVSLSYGKTYYLHKKPIAGMIKFGLDWDVDGYQLCEVDALDAGRGFGVTFEIRDASGRDRYAVRTVGGRSIRCTT